ncbi:glycosyltransferase family 2 protein [Demequina sp. SO4-13]|uniref:glycosyltransferase family 2 protein n=1 Tax=Demequina sp. SO4-13 TaxID=3401027 RepID=UPI003AF720C7
MHTVSVIVPTYNAEDFLPTCLEVMRRSGDDGTQFIVVDDHSTDATPHILDAAVRRMPTLTVVRNDTNVGVARSRNIALDVADGRYLTYLDVDDWYGHGHLEALVRAIQDLEVDFVRTDHVRVDGYQRTLDRAPEKHRGVPLEAASGIGRAGSNAMVDYPFLWAGIYDTTRLPRDLFLFDESLRTAADRPWFWRLYMKAKSTAVVDLHGYFYRKDHNPRALTQAGNAQTLHFLDASARIRDLVVPAGRAEWTTKAAYAAARICAFHVTRRSRLSPELQAELFLRSASLLASYPHSTMDDAIRTLSLSQRMVARALVRRGRAS